MLTVSADCEKIFNQEWKLNAHKKGHIKYTCDQCEKGFQYESIKDIHTKVTHINAKLFCHFYNNDKECPKEQECVFLHKTSGPCRYMEKCERENCMYEHHSVDERNGDSERETNENNDDVNAIDVKDDEDDEGNEDISEKQYDDQDQINNEKDAINNEEPDGDNVEDSDQTFCNPSQSEEEESLTCEFCKYDAPNKEKLVKHTFEKHSVTGKWICFSCKDEFNSRKFFNSHKYHGCGS